MLEADMARFFGSAKEDFVGKTATETGEAGRCAWCTSRSMQRMPMCEAGSRFFSTMPVSV